MYFVPKRLKGLKKFVGKKRLPRSRGRWVPGTESPHAPVMTRQNLRDASPVHHDIRHDLSDRHTLTRRVAARGRRCILRSVPFEIASRDVGVGRRGDDGDGDDGARCDAMRCDADEDADEMGPMTGKRTWESGRWDSAASDESDAMTGLHHRAGVRARASGGRTTTERETTEETRPGQRRAHTPPLPDRELAAQRKKSKSTTVADRRRRCMRRRRR